MSGFYVDCATDATWGYPLGPARLRTHDETECADDETCLVHKPSDHHMRDWPLTWRADKRTMERQCPHGVDHPDPDDLAHHARRGETWQAVHGCDGCCHG